MRKAAALLVVALIAFAPHAPARAQSPSPTTEPRFEVASVKASPEGYPFEIKWGLNTWSSSGPLPLTQYLGLAFGATHYVGLPDWTRTESYTINAKAEDGVLLTRETLAPRLRQLLVERFKLAAHIETTYTGGYALVLAKAGPKMTATEKPPTMTQYRPDGVKAWSVNMDFFARQLARVVGQPVANETGLTANYEFTMTYAPTGALDSPLPSIFTALQDQLGLKLEGGRKVPVETLVVDHVEHPTED